MLESLLGKEVVSLKKGHGSFLTIDFDPILQEQSGKAPEIWVYLCHWELFRDGHSMCDSETVDSLFEFGFMSGLCLEKCITSEDGMGMDLIFSGGVILKVVADLLNYDPEDDLIRVSGIGGCVVGFSPSLGWAN